MACPGRVRRDPRVRPRDPGPRPGRRPGRDDPRVPVHVADPQRPVRGRPPRAGRARQRRQALAPSSASARRRPAVHQDQGRARRRQRRRRRRPARRGRPPAGRRCPLGGRRSGGRGRVSPAEIAASTQAARSARSRVSASSGPNGGVARGPAGSSRRSRPGRSRATGRSARSARRSRTPARRRSGRATPRCSRGLGALAPQPAGRRPHPSRGGPAGRWRRSARAANRGRSSGWSIWTCSMRGMSGSRPPTGVSRSSATRTAASPIAWIWVAMPPAAARCDEILEAGRVGHPQAPAPVRAAAGGPARLRGPRAARAVREPIEPSAKHFCQPTRARPAGSEPRTSPLRRPPARAVLQGVVPQAGVDPDRQPAGVGQMRVGRERVGEVRVRRERARVVARRRPRATPAPGRRRSRALARSASLANGMWTVTSRAAASNSTPSGDPSRAAGRCRRAGPRSPRSRRRSRRAARLTHSAW